eukprot:TRINITY_DN68599_c0_g1_i1.p1 TRINITY_DN68599_c0_g1~~TRINITY_DN68599_c0_g1_i1.p1  ORF type:complete len:877 (-),score=113.09 TRINITY_DN68599_c0_g1_i1:218-2614(-)
MPTAGAHSVTQGAASEHLPLQADTSGGFSSVTDGRSSQSDTRAVLPPIESSDASGSHGATNMEGRGTNAPATTSSGGRGHGLDGGSESVTDEGHESMTCDSPTRNIRESGCERVVEVGNGGAFSETGGSIALKSTVTSEPEVSSTIGVGRRELEESARADRSDCETELREFCSKRAYDAEKSRHIAGPVSDAGSHGAETVCSALRDATCQLQQPISPLEGATRKRDTSSSKRCRTAVGSTAVAAVQTPSKRLKATHRSCLSPVLPRQEQEQRQEHSAIQDKFDSIKANESACPVFPAETMERIWRKQVPFLYDLFAVHRRSCRPTAMCWLPGAARSHGSLLQRLALGVRDRRGKYALLLLAVRLPLLEQVAEAPENSGDTSCTSERTRVWATQRIPQDGPVTHIERSLHRTVHVATRSATGDVSVVNACTWEAPKDANGVPLGEHVCPSITHMRCAAANVAGKSPLQLRSKGGLSWSPHDARSLAAANADTTVVNLWDVEAQTCVVNLETHKDGCVEGFAFAPADPSVLAACGSDGRLRLWDVRCAVNESATSKTAAVVEVDAHAGSARCIAFGLPPTGDGAASMNLAPSFLATGGADAVVRLWDIRRVGAGPWHTLPLRQPCETSHARADASPSCACLTWSPRDAGLLSTMCDDGRVLLWDLARMSEGQTPIVAHEGSPELIFTHGGHTVGASNPTTLSCGDAEMALFSKGLAWSAEAPWVLGSFFPSRMRETRPVLRQDASSMPALAVPVPTVTAANSATSSLASIPVASATSTTPLFELHFWQPAACLVGGMTRP